MTIYGFIFIFYFVPELQVQYPGLEYQMKFDLATMALLSKSVAWVRF